MDKAPGLLEDLAAATRLHEGPEGVRKILRSIFRTGPVPIRDLARDLGIPVPVVAAVRGELEKRGLAVRESGVTLTEQGLEALAVASGIACRARFEVTRVLDLPASALPLVDAFADIAAGRPDADFSLDQSHATAETAVRRAIYLFENDAIEGRRLLFLGDDDLTSVAVRLLADSLGIRTEATTVLEVDERLVSYLGEHGVDARHHDLRQPIPASLHGGFDVFFTDPPYTAEGLDLFVGRGVRALEAAVGKLGFVSFGRKSPAEAVAIARILAAHGLAPVEMIPDFNRYDGAQLLAGSSQMIRCVSAGQGGGHDDTYDGPLYTRDARQRRADG